MVGESEHPYKFRAHNIDVANEPLLNDPQFAESFYPHGYEIVELGGRKIAIIGVTTETTVETSQPGKKVLFRDSIGALKALVPRLRSEQGVDHIIVSSHSGVQRDKQI